MIGADDILFRLGIDNRAFSQGLTRAKHEVAGFQSALAKIGMAISVGVLVAAGRRLIEWGDNLKDASENLGISTDFLQKFNYALEMTSGSAEKSQQNLAKLVKFIGEAREGEEKATKVFKDFSISLENGEGGLRTTEEMIGVIADKFRELGDVTARNSLGFEIFGRAGHEMAGALSVGSDAMKKLMDQASGRIISKEAIDSLDELQKKLNIIKGELAGGISWVHKQIATAAEFYGEMSVRGIPKNPQEFAQWQSQNDQAQKLLADATKLAEKKAAIAEAQRLEELRWQEIEKLQAIEWEKEEEDWLKLKEKENALEEKSVALTERKLDLEQRLTDLQRHRTEVMEDRSRFDLATLAGLRPGPWTTRTMMQDIGAARQVKWLEAQATRQAALGLFGPSQQTWSMADKIRGGIGSLVASDRDQFRSMRESAEETSAQIAKLVEMAQRQGLRIIPVNGP